jgi:hypothetical protein
MNPAGGAEKKRRGRPLKEADPTEDEKARRNREAQNRYKQKVGKQIGEVVNDLDNCEEERALLKEKVKGLTNLLKNCDEQVIDIMKAVNAMPKIGAKSRPKSSPAVSAQSPAPVETTGMKGMKMRKSTKVKIAVPIAERPLPTNQFSSRGVSTTTFSKRAGNIMFSKRQ